MNFDHTYVNIDLDIIARNFSAVQEKAGVPVMAVVKADAYGHGAVQVARLLSKQCAFSAFPPWLKPWNCAMPDWKTPS